MAVVLLSSPLQPQSDTKIITDKESYHDDSFIKFIGWFNVGSVSGMIIPIYV